MEIALPKGVVMKKHFRFLTLLFLLTVILLAPTLTSNSQAGAQDILDPACLSLCQQQHLACFIAAGGKNGAENHCLGEYRHCIAHCKH
jgi:hypothetical protein